MTYTPATVNKVSTDNSSTANLANDVAFTGTGEDVSKYASVTISIESSHDSAEGGVDVQFSTDNSNWFTVDKRTFLLEKEDHLTFNVEKKAQYYRIVYTNGGTTTTALRIQSILNANQKSNETYQKVEFDKQYMDGFSRLKVVQPTTLLDVHRVIDKNEVEILEHLEVSGTATHQSDEAMTELTVTTATDVALNQTRRRMVYQPGKTVLVLITGVLDKSNDVASISRIGWFDDNNGFYFQYTNATFSVVKRTRITGSVVNTTVNESDFNNDPNYTIDPKKANIFYIKTAWLGVSTTELGIFAHGETHPLHYFRNENNKDGAYMTLASLPCRWECLGGVGLLVASTCTAICASVSSLGGSESIGRTFSSNTGITAITVNNTEVPIISIRINPANYREECVQAVLKKVSIMVSTSANMLVRVWRFYDKAVASVLTAGPSWVAVSEGLGIEYDVSATAITTTGGLLLSSSYFSSDSDSVNIPTDDSAILTYNQHNSLSDLIVITCQNIAAQNESVYGSIDYTVII